MPSDNWLKQVPQVNDDMAWRVVDEECIIVDPQGSQATVLNPLGARLWELMDGNRSMQQILEQIVDEYDVTAEVAETDAREFVERLGARNLVTLS